MKISVFGSGGWGTALAMSLCGRHEVTLCSHSKASAEELDTSRESRRLPGVKIPRSIKITADKAEASRDITMAVLAPPSFAFSETLEALKGVLPQRCAVVNASKGLEAQTGRRFSEVSAEILGGDRAYCVLSGPSHAEEVARGEATLCVCASKDRAVAQMVQDAFMSSSLRIYTSTDVVGVELGGALKNIIALAAGMCDGLGVGDNTKAALVTRGLSEIARLGVKLGGKTETFCGLAGVGDLYVTCNSEHSRNRRMGRLVGGGTPPERAIEMAGGVVEGYYAVQTARELSARLGVDMPIAGEVYNVLFNSLEPKQAVANLMGRSKTHEYEEVWFSERKD